jgi:predicted DCC family thiol-disulfide oxidoreductase YuxK
VSVLLLVPRVLRDGVYDFVARHRYRWFGRTASCEVPGPEVRGRLLDEGNDEP